MKGLLFLLSSTLAISVFSGEDEISYHKSRNTAPKSEKMMMEERAKHVNPSARGCPNTNGFFGIADFL